ncbi:hypothetical protein GCM10023310_68970 [Paenibacillus vulneris]|uniref:DUF1653 domain-containing protein n=1 Tax=Paenibacillus vulneris TaxID=1133364 RepID=A0ABW3UHC5_9BACL
MYEVTCGQKYKHYKRGIYTISRMATHTETQEGLVIYYDKQRCYWVRPVEMFFGYLNDGTKRFVEIDEDAYEEEEVE